MLERALLRDAVLKDPCSTDFLMGAFFAALSSSRQASKLLSSVGDGSVHYEITTDEFMRFRCALENCCGIFDLAEHIEAHCPFRKRFGWKELRVDILQELLFLDSGDMRLRLIKGKRSDIVTTTPYERFEVQHSQEDEAHFQRLVKKYGTKMAFHGSSTENWYSILRSGLKASTNFMERCNGNIFSSGIYLTSDFKVAMAFSPVGEGWKRSKYGDRFSCVAVCEYINHPVLQQNSSQCKENIGESQNIPDNYILVPCDQMVRVKELIVFRQSSRGSGKAGGSLQCLFVAVLCYGLFLMFSGGFFSWENILEIPMNIVNAVSSGLGMNYSA